MRHWPGDEQNQATSQPASSSQVIKQATRVKQKRREEGNGQEKKSFAVQPRRPFVTTRSTAQDRFSKGGLEPGIWNAKHRDDGISLLLL